MRWLVRMLIFWAISAPLFYLFGMPYALEMLSKKAQTQAYDQCAAGLRDQHLIDGPNPPISPDQGDHYCHCMADGLILTKPDLFDILKKKPPAALNATAKTLAEKCNRDMEATMRGGMAPATPAAAPAGEEEVIHF